MTDRDARHGAEGSAGGDARSIELTHALVGEAVEQSDHAVFLSSESDGLYVAVNDAARRLTGYERAELLTLTARNLSARSPTEVDTHYEQPRERRYLRGTARIRRSDGTEVEIDCWGSRTRLGGGELLLTVTDAVGTARLVECAARARETAHALREDASALRAQARQQVRRNDVARRAGPPVSLDPRDAAILADVLLRRMDDCWARFEDAAEELAALHEVGVDELLFAVRRAVVRGNS